MDVDASAARSNLVADALRSWGRLRVRALGVSMLPSLWPGDLLTIQSCRADGIEPGEIALWIRDRRFFIHRVIGKSLTGDEAMLLTRGDCMAQDDSPVRVAELLGKVIEVERAGTVFSPARSLTFFQTAAAYMLCHFGLFRRAGLRLWELRRPVGRPTEHTLEGIAS